MKKTSAFVLLSALLTTSALAQIKSPIPLGTPVAPGVLFRQGTTAVNLGLGLGTGYGFGNSLESSPAVSLSAEKGLVEGIGPGVIGVGGLVGYKSYHYDYAGTSDKARWTNVIVLARGTYHYDLLEVNKLDTYAGVSLGFRVESFKNPQNDEALKQRYNESYGGLRFERGIFLGARYFVTDGIGAFAEAGYDMTYLKFGLTASF
ncbi:hypothetical protein GCM10027346_21360 [Hymenobacter seoulensis]